MKQDITVDLTRWQKAFEEHYEAGRSILVERLTEFPAVTILHRQVSGLAGASATGDAKEGRYGLFQAPIGMLTRIKAVVVGLDLREYSARESEEQLLLTVRLQASIGKAIEILKQGGIIEPDEPRIIEHTGDGALVVFTSVDDYRQGLDQEHDEWRRWLEAPSAENGKKEEAAKAWSKVKRRTETSCFPQVVDQAMAFVFCLNAIIGSDNTRNAFALGPGAAQNSYVPAYPVECRFAVSYDDILLRTEKGGNLKCSGGGLVTCQRILSSDHGTHLLLHAELLRQLEGHGGISSVCRGQWGHRLHHALLPQSVLKNRAYRFVDVFGFHHDGPLLRALGRDYEEAREYHIGSHNIASIDGP